MQSKRTPFSTALRLICARCADPITANTSDRSRRYPRRFCSNRCYLASPRAALPRQPLSVRFFLKVAKTPCCWRWIGSRNKHGYGYIGLGGKHGKNIRAHRASWLLYRGPIPDGLHVLHNCPCGDNPNCVNPAHLWLGDHAANMADKSAKGRIRVAVGEAQGNARLTEAQVIEIRARYAVGGVSQARLAREYGVGQPHISSILRRTAWRHLDT